MKFKLFFFILFCILTLSNLIYGKLNNPHFFEEAYLNGYMLISAILVFIGLLPSIFWHCKTSCNSTKSPAADLPKLRSKNG